MMRMARDTLIDSVTSGAHIEKLVICASNKLALFGASMAGISGATARVIGPTTISDVCGIVGATMGVLFTVSSVYFNFKKHRRHEERLITDKAFAEARDRREEDEHKLKVEHALRQLGIADIKKSKPSELLDDDS